MTPRLEWVSERDGESHAARPRAARTLCGRPAIDPRYGYGFARRCPDCLAAAEQLLHAARDVKAAPIGR